MQILVDADGVSLAEPDTFTDFSVQVAPGFSGELAQALAAYGTVTPDAGHAHITRRGIETLAGPRAADAEWRRSLDAMIDYANGKGWVDTDGGVRAHVVTA